MMDLIERARKEETLLNGYYRMPKAAAVMSELIAALEAAREDAERWRERYVAQLACYRQDLHGDMANDAIDRAEKAAERIAMLDQARGKGANDEA